jgi:hypothetical protein
MRDTGLASISVLLLIACFLLTGCPPSNPVPNNNPPAVSWSLYDLATRQTQNINGAGAGTPTVFVNPGDEYMVTFHATSTAGIQSITMSGQGKVICNGNKPPYTEANPFPYSVAPTTITLSPPAGQVYTQAANPYGFIWGEVNPPGQPPYFGPTFPALTKCGNNVPLLGTTTFTGTATTNSNVSSSPTQLNVTTCAVSTGC